MLSRSLSHSIKQLGTTFKPRYFINHIRNMDEESVKVIAEEMAHEPDVLPNDRIYKPTYTIEFNREGEVLLYSGNPIKNENIYFKFPYIFCISAVTKMKVSFRCRSSTTCSTRSILFGIGTHSSSTSLPSC